MRIKRLNIKLTIADNGHSELDIDKFINYLSTMQRVIQMRRGRFTRTLFSSLAFSSLNKKAALSQGNRAMPQLLFSV